MFQNFIAHVRNPLWFSVVSLFTMKTIQKEEDRSFESWESIENRYAFSMKGSFLLCSSFRFFFFRST